MITAITNHDTVSDMKYISDSLFIYKPEYINVIGYRICEDDILIEFKLESYPFTNGDYLNYLTAPTSTLNLAQGGYIYLNSLIDEKLQKLRANCNLDYRKIVAAGDVVFTRITSNFLAKMPLDLKSYTAVFKTNRMFVRSNRIYADITVTDVGHRYFRQTARIVAG